MQQTKRLHFCSVNWCNKHDLPTPMSPTMMYLNMYEYCEEDMSKALEQKTIINSRTTR